MSGMSLASQKEVCHFIKTDNHLWSNIAVEHGLKAGNDILKCKKNFLGVITVFVFYLNNFGISWRLL